MKTIKYLLSVLSISFLLSSCSKTIDFDLKESEVKLVVDGLITTASPARVKLSETYNFYSTQSTPPPVKDAIVILSDNTGLVDTLDEISDGYYQSTILGVENRMYSLKILSKGVEYTASSLLPSVSPIDSLSYIFKPASIFQAEGYYPLFYGSDPPGEVNFYLAKFYRNDTFLLGPTEVYVLDDKFLQENVDGVEFPYVYQLGDTARIDFMSVTEETYQFYMDLQAQLNNDGGFFSTPPANAKGNISNGALGLFQASDIETASIVIK